MSGHSKWSTIKRKKAANDSKRSAIFTKLIKEITVATREGGPDPEGNARLRLAIQNGRKANVPKDVIERAVNKGSGSDSADYIETLYEGYAPGGVAIMVECATDNINRTVANVRSYFNKAGGSLGTSGSVGYMFERKGVFSVPAEGLDEDEFMLEMIDAGAEDAAKEDEFFNVTCDFEDFGNLNAKFEEMGLEPESANLERIPGNTIELDWAGAQKVLKLIETIEDDEDVQKVFHNLELTDEVAAELDRA